MEKMLVIAKIQRGIEQADRGETLSRDEVQHRVSKWLK